MSKPGRRSNREARKEHKAKLKAARKELRKRQINGSALNGAVELCVPNGFEG